MTIHAWRIVKARLAADAFSGDGARVYGGRWNSPGIRVVYTAGSTSLAILGMLVHLQAQDLLQRYVVFEVAFTKSLIRTVGLDELPKAWRRSPPPEIVQRVGDVWIGMGDTAVLQLPSAIVPGEWNYLLNPAHPEFSKITIGPKQRIKFDPRLLKPLPP